MNYLRQVCFRKSYLLYVVKSNSKEIVVMLLKDALLGLRQFLAMKSPLTLKKLRMGDHFEFDLLLCGFSKNVSSRDRVKP